jgi:SAM-dependent methyltransferase
MSWDPVWESIFQESEWGKYPGEDVIRFVARNFYSRRRADVKILEVGCGPGANIWYLAREGFDAHGIDGSETAIKRCRERLAAEGLHATLHVGGISTLPYDDATFDAVLDIECLYANSLADARRIMNEIVCVMKPGAKFYSRAFANDGTSIEDGDRMSETEFAAVHSGRFKGKGFVRFIDEATIKELYGSALDVESIERMFTRDNGATVVSEWLVACVKPDHARARP